MPDSPPSWGLPCRPPPKVLRGAASPSTYGCLPGRPPNVFRGLPAALPPANALRGGEAGRGGYDGFPVAPRVFPSVEGEAAEGVGDGVGIPITAPIVLPVRAP